MLSEISCARPKLIGVPPCGVPISTPEPNTNMGESPVGREGRGEARRPRGLLESIVKWGDSSRGRGKGARPGLRTAPGPDEHGGIDCRDPEVAPLKPREN